jgi:CelD/BcsL family acetyltransferase involved in cellulose biosynthesis
LSYARSGEVDLDVSSVRSTGTLTFETISTEASFAALAGTWDELVRAMPRPSPFFLHGWLLEWLRHYAEGVTLMIQVAYRDGRLIAAIPLLVGSRRGLKVARFLGGRQSVLADLLLAEGEEPSVGKTLAERAGSSGQDMADLFGLPAESRLVAALGPSRLGLVERVEAPVLDLSPGWDTVYEAKMSSKTRRKHRWCRRRLSDFGRLEVSVARTHEELEPALEDGFRLHALRWQGRSDGSGFVTPTGLRFHRAALRALAEIDVPRIVTLRLDGRAIAFHYYFALEGRMYVHRLAFDPALEHFSPGLINTLDAIEVASAEGLTRVEFLGGAEHYKMNLADRLEPLYGGIGLATSPLGHAVVTAQLGTIRLRKRLKRSPRLRRLYLEGLAPMRRIAARSKDAHSA